MCAPPPVHSPGTVELLYKAFLSVFSKLDWRLRFECFRVFAKGV